MERGVILTFFYSGVRVSTLKWVKNAFFFDHCNIKFRKFLSFFGDELGGGMRWTPKNLSKNRTIIVLFWGYLATGFFQVFFPKNGIFEPEMSNKPKNNYDPIGKDSTNPPSIEAVNIKKSKRYKTPGAQIQMPTLC